MTFFAAYQREFSTRALRMVLGVDVASFNEGGANATYPAYMYGNMSTYLQMVFLGGPYLPPTIMSNSIITHFIEVIL